MYLSSLVQGLGALVLGRGFGTLGLGFAYSAVSPKPNIKETFRSLQIIDVLNFISSKAARRLRAQGPKAVLKSVFRLQY